MKDDRASRSKRLAYILRHEPSTVGLTLDREGWVDLASLLAALSSHGTPYTAEEIEEIVRLDSKGRYQLEAGRIRAVQGHSNPQVDRSFPERQPPARLFHGTTSAVLQVILAEGLKPMGRQYLHLSPDEKTARAVGARHVKKGAQLVVLVIDAAGMHSRGRRFFLAENGVWLVEAVEPDFISVA